MQIRSLIKTILVVECIGVLFWFIMFDVLNLNTHSSVQIDIPPAKEQPIRSIDDTSGGHL